MQLIAYNNPCARAGDAQHPRFFLRLDDGWSVGLTVNK